MTKKDESTATPRLRFPEFRGREAWDVMPMGDLITLEYGVSLPEYSRRSGRIPVVGANGIVGYHDQALINGPAIIVGRKGSVGQVNWIESDCFPIDTTFYVENKNSAANSTQFLYRLLQISKLEHRRDPGAVPGLSRSEVYSLEVARPSRAEQQKIADCLTSLDELIAATGRKVVALKTHKRWLMQQLFPREGETVPRLRFPEFRDRPEWRAVPLVQLLQSRPQYGVNEPAVAYSRNLPTYLRITDIDDDGRFIAEGKVSVDIDPAADDYLSDGDIVLARTGASVGKSYRYRNEDGRLVFAGFLIRVRPNKSTIVPSFLSSFLATNRYWDWVRLTSARSGQPGINGSEYGTLPVPVPPPSRTTDDLAEQRRIAECFSAVDDLITAESGALITLEAHKTGLMQQLFPLPGGVKP